MNPMLLKIKTQISIVKQKFVSLGEMLFAQKISDIWDVSASLNWYNNVIDAYSGTIRFPYERSFSIEETIDQTWDMKVNSQFHLSSKTEIQFTGIYIAPKNIPQGRRLSRSSIDIGIKKTVLAGKGTITFSFSDIFNDFGIREEIVEKDFTALYENYFETQVARIAFNYKF